MYFFIYSFMQSDHNVISLYVIYLASDTCLLGLIDSECSMAHVDII